ncbi:MAG TPA: hypothetical protein VHT21_12760 [Stellaceae bacterium]|jgi:hypothetical protein|nr:hypothetical protein [Stellaceae bacterium]
MTPIGFEWHEAVGERRCVVIGGIPTLGGPHPHVGRRRRQISNEVIVTFRELARTLTQRRESYLSPPNGFSVVLSLNSAGRSISEARRFPSCCS